MAGVMQWTALWRGAPLEGAYTLVDRVKKGFRVMRRRGIGSLFAVTMVMVGLGTTLAQSIQTPSSAQDDVVSASDDVTLSLTYSFVNFVNAGGDVTEQLSIAGADTFDSAPGGTVEYSFANATTHLYAEIVSVNGVTPTDELADWYQDAENHLEFGIANGDVSDRSDFNGTSGSGEAARLFPGDGSDQPVKALLDGSGMYVAGSLNDRLHGTDGGGANSFEYSYYIAQRGDGPEMGFGDTSPETTNGDSVTIQFTVASE